MKTILTLWDKIICLFELIYMLIKYRSYEKTKEVLDGEIVDLKRKIKEFRGELEDDRLSDCWPTINNNGGK